MKCPRCKLVSPPNAMWCDCGYDFKTGQLLFRGPKPKSKIAQFAGWIATVIWMSIGLGLVRTYGAVVLRPLVIFYVVLWSVPVVIFFVVLWTIGKRKD